MQDPWAAIQADPAWQAHAKALGRLWTAHEKARLSKVRQWAEVHLQGPRGSASTLFYPFGGPDALYAVTLFPATPTYVLVGLEPVGSGPDLSTLSREGRGRSLKDMEVYITPILQISFFRTNDMREELAGKGTIPILLTFLAGTGHRILDVELLSIRGDGAVAPFAGEGKASAARITFVAEGAVTPQSLIYISQDLSNEGLKKAPAFGAFMAKMERPATLLKAASYLMHRDAFSEIRDFILGNSLSVLEDDSGIPLRSFARDRWNLSFFGTYTGPIKLFQSFTQKGLQEAYHGAGTVAPLAFGIGYQHRAGDSNLMLAIKRP